MTWMFPYIVLVLLCINQVRPKEDEDVIEPKDKIISLQGKSIFNVVSFPNIGCASSTSGRNGTCYSTSECSSRGGTPSGSCANGFGVCCVIMPGCGQTSSENNTYLVMSSTSSPPVQCTYTICPCNSNICRIRFDFTTFVINGPATTTVGNNATGGALGDCNVDAFSVTSPGSRGSPIICGYNTGQHMYVDAAPNMCSKVHFNFQNSVSFSRAYDIKVTQYVCGDEYAGPPDCLQYFNTNTGTVSSFNFFTVGGAVTSAVTHLSNQYYDICFRRNSGNCALCFSPAVNVTTGATAMNQNSFGLSNPTGTTASGTTDANCISDYLTIPQGTLGNLTSGTAYIFLPTGTVQKSRICGRYFNVDTTETTNVATICTGRRPFRISFRTDLDEVTSATGGGTTATDETVGVPEGTIGFSLNFFQVAC